MSNITQQDYYLKNFISKSLAIIASKENSDNLNSLIKIIIENLDSSIQNHYNFVDNYLRLIFNILKESDDTISCFTGDIMPEILKVFLFSSVRKYLLYKSFV